MSLAVPPGGTPPPAESRQDFARCPSSQSTASYPAHSNASPRRAASTRPIITVVIVNFCQWRNTARLVSQLRQSYSLRTGAAEIIVIDNHSPFQSISSKLERMHGVTVRRFGRNLGFARAVNRGLEERPGENHAGTQPNEEWVLLLNPDVTVEEGFLDDAVNAIEQLDRLDPRAGVVGFRLLNADGSLQASSGSFPTLFGTLSRLFLPRSRRKCSNRPDSSRQTVDWATGGCLLVRRSCFDELRGLDESFFLYYEDVDFCRRATDAGWTIWFDPSMRVTHHWPLHKRSVPAPLRLMTRHALLTYTSKHWSAWRSRVISGVVWAEAALSQCWAAVRGDRTAARCHAELRRLVGDIAAGRDSDVRRRVRFAASFLNPIAAKQDGCTG